VHVSRTDWGAQAVARLIDFLEREVPFPMERIPARLIARESSLIKPPPASQSSP